MTIYWIFMKHMFLLKRYTANHVPFELGVDFNDDEVCTAETSPLTCEFLVVNSATISGGGGITGFSLCYTQT